MSLDTNAILDAIRAALQQAPGGDGLTVPEIAAAMHPPRHQETVRKAIKRLIAEGTMEPCRALRMRMDGIMSPVSAYRFRDSGPPVVH